MLRPADAYADVLAAFRWKIPAHCNIGVDVVDKHVLEGRGDQLALIYEIEDGAVEHFSFADVARKSNQLANLLVAQGIRSGATASGSPNARRPGREDRASGGG
jgi:acetyl-CoA synthetase